MVKIPSQRIILIPPKARQALNRDTNISFKKADKGTTTLALNIEDKIKEGQTQIDDREHYKTSYESYGRRNEPKSSTAY